MASSKPLDIVARFRTVTTDFNTREVEKELADADRAFDKSSRKAKDWDRTLRRSADDAADGMRKGKSKFASAGAEVGDEFAENIGEGLRNGDYVGVLTETMTSLTPALGAIGLAAGAAIGIGAGILADMKAKEEQIKQMGRTLFDALSDGYLEQAEKENLLKDAFSTDDLGEAYRQLERKAKSLGTDSKSLLDEIISGGRKTTALDEIEAQMLALDAKVKAGGLTPRGPALVELNAWRDYWQLQERIRKSIEQTNAALRTRSTIVGGSTSGGTNPATRPDRRREP